MRQAAEAYSVVGVFPPAERAEFSFDRHYLLYCTAGSMRLEAQGNVWSLTPSRAALIAARQSVHVSLPRTVTACSVLFDTGFIPSPATALVVVNMNSLARELILACRGWTETDRPLSPYAQKIFAALAAVVGQLAVKPSNATMPVPATGGVAAAMALTEQRMADSPDFASIARDVAMTERSLARHFANEMQMTWRQALRRLRVIRAMELLAEEGATITETAYAVGYSSLSAFNAAFMEVSGETPTAYRTGMGNAHRFDPAYAAGRR